MRRGSGWVRRADQPDSGRWLEVVSGPKLNGSGMNGRCSALWTIAHLSGVDRREPTYGPLPI